MKGKVVKAADEMLHIKQIHTRSNCVQRLYANNVTCKLYFPPPIQVYVILGIYVHNQVHVSVTHIKQSVKMSPRVFKELLIEEI